MEGLTYTELRLLSERLGEQAERQGDAAAEFSVPTWSLLNSLEGLGYRVMGNGRSYLMSMKFLQVVTSDQFVSGTGTFDIKEFVWTLHKNKDDWEMSS